MNYSSTLIDLRTNIHHTQHTNSSFFRLTLIFTDSDFLFSEMWFTDSDLFLIKMWFTDSDLFSIEGAQRCDF